MQNPDKKKPLNIFIKSLLIILTIYVVYNIACFIFLAIALYQTDTVEYDRAMYFKLSTEKTGQDIIMRIAAVPFTSYPRYDKKIHQFQEEKNVVIKIDLYGLPFGKANNYDRFYEFKMSKDTEKVMFGNLRKVIWEKNKYIETTKGSFVIKYTKEEMKNVLKNKP